MDKAVAGKCSAVRDRGEGIIRWALAGLGILVFSFLAICSLVFIAYYSRETYAELVLYRWQNPLLGLLMVGLFVAGLCLACWWGRKLRIKPSTVTRVGLIVIVLTGLFWVLLTRCYPYGEPRNLLKCAYSFMNWDDSPLQRLVPANDNVDGYLYIFPFQLGPVFLLEKVYSLFGWENHTVMYLFHVACLGAIFALSVDITQRMFQDKFSASISVLLMLGSLYLVVFITFLYPILPGLALSLLAIWCTCRFWQDRKRGLGFLLLGAVAQALAIFLKSNYLIFAVGLGLVLLVDFIKKPDKAIPIAMAAFLVCSFGLRTAVNSHYENRTGLTIDKGVPAIVWTAMGLADDSYMAPGWYNHSSYLQYPSHDFDQQASKQAAWESIQTSLARMAADGSGPSFFFWKTVSQWNEPTMGAFLPSHYLSAEQYQEEAHARSQFGIDLFYGRPNDMLLFVMDKVHMLVYCGALLCLALNVKRITIRQLLPFVILLGGLLFHTFLWEGKSQYIASYFVLALPYAAAGYAQLARWLLDKALPFVRKKLPAKQ